MHVFCIYHQKIGSLLEKAENTKYFIILRPIKLAKRKNTDHIKYKELRNLERKFFASLIGRRIMKLKQLAQEVVDEYDFTKLV
jgi:hypothetical protein